MRAASRLKLKKQLIITLGNGYSGINYRLTQILDGTGENIRKLYVE